MHRLVHFPDGTAVLANLERERYGLQFYKFNSPTVDIKGISDFLTNDTEPT